MEDFSMERIQTLYLILVIVANALILYTPIFIVARRFPEAWLVALLVGGGIAAALFAAIAIILYYRPETQLKTCNLALLGQGVLFGTAVGIFISMPGINMQSFEAIAGIALPFVGIILILIAKSAIKRDYYG